MSVSSPERPKSHPFGWLSDGSLIIRHRATFPQCSILADAGLNFCVRDGNRCDPSSMGTDHNVLVSAITLSSGSLDRINYICANNLRQSQTRQMIDRVKNSTTNSVIVDSEPRSVDQNSESTHKKAMGLLVHFSSIHYCTSTLCLSN